MQISQDLLDSAWSQLEKSIITYNDKPIGTFAACGDLMEPLNYDQCFTRDFAISAAAFLLRGDTEIVRNFLIASAQLQTQDKQMDCFKPGQGLMPASFKVVHHEGEEAITADFGERAIARVPPIDSGFWWLIILRFYIKTTGDFDLACRTNFQHAIRLILDLCLVARFDMFPTMLVPDGSYMIDRRLGVYGYPLDIQVLFFTALQAAQDLLTPTSDNEAHLKAAHERLSHLTFHIRQYYWLDLSHLNQIYRYKADEFGETAVNKFNIYPDSIPPWLEGWLVEDGGYFAGNLGPARMDFRWFAHGNLISIWGGLADEIQTRAILHQIEARWEDLVGAMPVKVCFPAIEGRDWQVMTGSDPKNKAWSYHNGGNWPFLLLPFVVAAMKGDRTDLAERAFEIAAERLADDQWPEYYDGKTGRLIGKEARVLQTWTIAGFLAAYQLLQNPDGLDMFLFDQPSLIPCDIPQKATPIVL